MKFTDWINKKSLKEQSASSVSRQSKKFKITTFKEWVDSQIVIKAIVYKDVVLKEVEFKHLVLNPESLPKGDVNAWKATKYCPTCGTEYPPKKGEKSWRPTKKTKCDKEISKSKEELCGGELTDKGEEKQCRDCGEIHYPSIQGGKKIFPPKCNKKVFKGKSYKCDTALEMQPPPKTKNILAVKFENPNILCIADLALGGDIIGKIWSPKDFVDMNMEKIARISPLKSLFPHLYGKRKKSNITATYYNPPNNNKKNGDPITHEEFATYLSQGAKLEILEEKRRHPDMYWAYNIYDHDTGLHTYERTNPSEYENLDKKAAQQSQYGPVLRDIVTGNPIPDMTQDNRGMPQNLYLCPVCREKVTIKPHENTHYLALNTASNKYSILPNKPELKDMEEKGRLMQASPCGHAFFDTVSTYNIYKNVDPVGEFMLKKLRLIPTKNILEPMTIRTSVEGRKKGEDRIIGPEELKGGFSVGSREMPLSQLDGPETYA